jgi:signal transduction histidine kinase/CheY-like chemotaxis protein
MLCSLALAAMILSRVYFGRGGIPFWVVIVPILAAILIGIRSAVIWGVISTLALLILNTAVPFREGFVDPAVVTASLIALLWVTTLLVAGLMQANDRIVRSLETARHEAQKANAAKSRFLARVSHELRTPMTGIIGLTEALSDSELPSTPRMYVETLRQTQSSLIHIINDIIDLSQVEAGQLVIQPRAFELPELIKQVDHLYQDRAFRADLNWKCEIEADVPRWIRGDPGRIRQVLHNFLSNAFKFTQTGGIHLRVAVANENGEEISLLFEVGDTGHGVPLSDQKSLFSEFGQLDPSASGSGLGLAINKRLVEAMDGTIGLDSEAGQGSRFWFELPLLRSTEPSVRMAPALTQQIPSLQPLEVLVAEDHTLTQKVARIMLEGLGCSVTIAANGLEAVEWVKQKSFDLILMDCRMPEMDGLEATQQIHRELPKDQRPPIVALTAQAIKGDRERCLAAGMDDYLAKPFTRDQLMGILTRWGPT